MIAKEQYPERGSGNAVRLLLAGLMTYCAFQEILLAGLGMSRLVADHLGVRRWSDKEMSTVNTSADLVNLVVIIMK